MTINDVAKYIRKRAGMVDDADVLETINTTWLQLWSTLDTESALFELDVNVSANRLVTLPPYVFQVKGVKRFSGDAINLFTPRPYYQEFNYRQHSLEWRELKKTPLLRTINPACQIRLVAKKANGAAFTVSMKGTTSFGAVEREDITFEAADTEHLTATQFIDLQSFAKSGVTNVDVTAYDANGNIVSILAADRTDTWCILMRVVDKNHAPIANAFYYTVLYKTHAPVFTSLNDVIPDDWGIVLQQAATAETLNESKDKEDQERAGKFERKADDFSHEVGRRAEEGKDIRVHVSPNPFVSVYHGHL